MLGICPDATLVDITHDVAAARRARGRAAARRVLSLLSCRHHLPRGRRSRRRLGAARHGGRGGRLPVRRARQRRADRVLRETPPQARRRADRAPLRAADGEPDVRGPRPFRARGRVAGQGHAADRARPHRHGLSPPRHPAARRRAATTLRGVVLRVDRFGNLVTNIDRKTFEAFAKQGEFRILAGGTPVDRLVSTYAEIAAGRGVRALRQLRPPRARGQRRQRGRTPWRSARGAAVQVEIGSWSMLTHATADRSSALDPSEPNLCIVRFA